MKLLVDVGNTRCKWADWDGNKLSEHGNVLRADQDGPVPDLWMSYAPPEAVWISNVAGEEVATALREWVDEYWQVPVHFLVAEAEALGVRNAYTDPGQLGVDRWAALLAVAPDQQATCIVDCGTAVTVDVLAADGEHLGGLILPGLGMMRSTLSSRTEGIPEVEEGDVSLLARNTQDGVVAGTLYTLVAAIDRVSSDVAAELGGSMELIITGGDAGQISRLLAEPWHVEGDLVLQGLAVVAG